MKSLQQYILEASVKNVNFASHMYELDKTVKNCAKSAGKEAHDLEFDAQIASINDIKSLELWKQGCKWVVAYPPHKGSGGDVNYYIISMFVGSKKYHDMYMGAERQVVINTKTCEIENKDKLQQEGKDWKIIRLD